MEDALWSLQQQSRVLQELRLEIHGIWDDEAARDLNVRYLDSHQTDDQRMLATLRSQNEAVTATSARFYVAHVHALAVHHAAEQVRERLEHVTEDMRSSHSNYDIYVRYNSDARSKAPRVHALLNRADSACPD